MKIEISEIKKICQDVLEGLGFDDEQSEIIFQEYLYGEMSEIKSHCFLSFLNITKKVKSKQGDWGIIKEDDSYALINGNGNLGQLVGRFAMDLAIKKAKENGIALVGMNNMESYLMPGYYAKMIADQDMIGIVIDNSKSRVAPYGGFEPKLGANPIGLALPTKDIPFVLDMATAKRAMGEVRLARKLEKLLPENFAYDKKGSFTRDPDKVNSLVSFGEYKGYGLCLAIEILAGTFVRAKMGSKIEKGLDRGYLFLVINPEIFVSISDFKEEVSQLFKEIKSSKRLAGVEEILMPGEGSSQIRKQNQGNGYLDIDEKIFNEIKGLV